MKTEETSNALGRKESLVSNFLLLKDKCMIAHSWHQKKLPPLFEAMVNLAEFS